MIEVGRQIPKISCVNRDKIARANFTRLTHFELDDVGAALVGNKARVHRGRVVQGGRAAARGAGQRPFVAKGLGGGASRTGTVQGHGRADANDLDAAGIGGQID